jgi:hypothetical protein
MLLCKRDQATTELVGTNPLAGMPGIGDIAPKFEVPNQIGRAFRDRP